MATINLSWTPSNPAPAFGYRIKYWRTDTPGSVSTVTPNVTGSSYSIVNLTDGVNYSGTVEAACYGGAYSTPQSWSVTAQSSGGGGNTGGGENTGGGGGGTTTYYYDVTEFDCTVNCTQIGLLAQKVAASTSQLTVGTYYKNSGDLSSFRVEQASASSTADVTISSNATSGSTCYEACGTTPEIINDIYLNAYEGTAGSNKTVNWVLNTSASTTTSNVTLPFYMKVAYTATGFGVNGGSTTFSSSVVISGLEFPDGTGTNSQGTTAYNWTNITNLSIAFSTDGGSTYATPISVLGSNGGNVTNPASIVYQGTTYKVNVMINSNLRF